MKAYRSYKDLKKNEVEEKDYCIRYRNGNSGIVLMAPHGGAIEPGTAEVADAVAGRQHSYYAFCGTKVEQNAGLHREFFKNASGTTLIKNNSFFVILVDALRTELGDYTPTRVPYDVSEFL